VFYFGSNLGKNILLLKIKTTQQIISKKNILLPFRISKFSFLWHMTDMTKLSEQILFIFRPICQQRATEYKILNRSFQWKNSVNKWKKKISLLCWNVKTERLNFISISAWQNIFKIFQWDLNLRPSNFETEPLPLHSLCCTKMWTFSMIKHFIKLKLAQVTHACLYVLLEIFSNFDVN
jgi:hypothetical protein